MAIAGQPDAFFHSAGQHAGHQVLIPGKSLTKLSFILTRMLMIFGAQARVFLQRQADVFFNRHRIDEGGRLKTHPEPAFDFFFLVFREGRDVFVAKENLAGVGFDRAGHMPQERALPAPRAPHNDKGFALINVQVDAVQDLAALENFTRFRTEMAI